MTQTQLNPLSTGLFLHLLFNPIEILLILKIGQSGGVAAAFFSLRRPKNFENEKFFLCLKIAEIDMGVNFRSRRTILDIKTHFLNVKPIFRG